MTDRPFHLHILPGMPVTREAAMYPRHFWRGGKWVASGYLCGEAPPDNFDRARYETLGLDPDL